MLPNSDVIGTFEPSIQSAPNEIPFPWSHKNQERQKLSQANRFILLQSIPFIMFISKIATLFLLSALPTSFADEEEFILQASGPCETSAGQTGWKYTLSVYPEPVDDDGPSTNQVEIELDIEKPVPQGELQDLAEYTFTVNLSYDMAEHEAKSQVARLIQPLDSEDPPEAEVAVEWTTDFTPAEDGVAEFTAMAVNEANTVVCSVTIRDMDGAFAAIFS